ncbi:MAG: element excision factor XisH family protein [Blastocatellia bacterium]
MTQQKYEAVKQALISDGWQITNEPFVMAYTDVRWSADLGAEKATATATGSRKIVVEIANLEGVSFIGRFHEETGRYGNYRSLLKAIDPERPIYLAIPSKVYESHFTNQAIRAIVTDRRIGLMVYDSERQEIVQWVN